MKSFSARPFEVSRYAEAVVPTEYGRMTIAVYHEAGTPHEHCAISYGDIQGKQNVLTRVHSECFTGEVLHSLKCDCREQLDYAMRAIVEEGAGIIVYLRQEGRGIGLGNKIRAYALQEEKGADTVDANRLLGFEDDLRRYHVATSIFHEYGINSVRLLTNNPLKVDALREAGLEVERVPVQIDAHTHNEGYISTKKLRMGHLF